MLQSESSTTISAGVTALEYDFETATAAELVGMIQAATAKNGEPFESVALECFASGLASGNSWQISKNLT